MTGYMSHNYVAVKNNEYKAMLKIVVNVLNSLQVPAQVYWAKCSPNWEI